MPPYMTLYPLWQVKSILGRLFGSLSFTVWMLDKLYLK